MPIPVIYPSAHAAHVPDEEIWVGVKIPGTELPARGNIVAAALRSAGYLLEEPGPIDDEDLATVHDPDFLSFLRSAYDRWQESGYPAEPGQDHVVPYAFPLAAMTSGRAPRIPASIGALTGMYAMDTMTLIGPGTWAAARAAAAAALTAASRVAHGEPTVYAAVRPPGHHAGRSFYGGSCYLNNAALAAARLLDLTGQPVAVIDIDAHHGNGTQEIFYGTDRVRYGSVHNDPAAGYFPHWLGFADETGIGDGEGANLNLPLPTETGDGEWLRAVEQLAGFAGGAEYLIISLGVDAYAGDPESPLRVTVGGYREAGTILAGLGLPAVIVQEGGYDLGALAALVLGFLGPFAT
ncbi:MAG: histone deacetylase family protein [Actinomycetota bacterium]